MKNRSTVIFVVCLICASVAETTFATEPPTIPDSPVIYRYSPFRFETPEGEPGDCGENHIDILKDIHFPLQVYRAWNTPSEWECYVDKFREFISTPTTLLFISSHSSSGRDKLAVEVYTGDFGFENAQIAEKRYVDGVDDGDPEVFAAHSYTAIDNVDNDRDGNVDEMGEWYEPKWDNDENGVMELWEEGCPLPVSKAPGCELPGGSDPDCQFDYCGDKNGDGCPGDCRCGIEDEFSRDLGDDDHDQHIFWWNGRWDHFNGNEVMASGGWIYVTTDFIRKFAAFGNSLVVAGFCQSTVFASSFFDGGASYYLGFNADMSCADAHDDTRQWVGGMTGLVETGESSVLTNAPAGSFPSLPSGCSTVLSKTKEDVRIYNPPRIVEMLVTDEEGDTVYEYVYSREYPFIAGHYPNEGLIDTGKRKTAEVGGQVSVSIYFSRSMDPSIIVVWILPEDGDRSKAVRVNGSFVGGGIVNDHWVGEPTKIPEGFPEGLAIVEVAGSDDFALDIHSCLDIDGDGSSANEPDCVDRNHKIDIGVSIISFEAVGLSPENPAGIGDEVEFRIEFSSEMCTDSVPHLRAVEGIGRLEFDLDGYWFDINDKPYSLFIGKAILPRKYSQAALGIEFEVSGVMTAAGKEVDPKKTDKDGQPLLGWMDLVSPVVVIKNVVEPAVPCGRLEIDYEIEDEPERDVVGGVVVPPFERMPKTEYHAESLEVWPWSWEYYFDPMETFMAFVNFRSRERYKWWYEVEDRANNEASCEGEFWFKIDDCETTYEEWLRCLTIRCRPAERKCELVDWCAQYEGCGARCDNGYCHGPWSCFAFGCGEYPDENNDLSDLFPIWANVRNYDPVSRIGVLAYGEYAAMFGLLDSVGESSRIVELPISPEVLSEVQLLIIPSGGLRNQQTTSFSEALLQYVEGGGNLLVMSQPLGEDFTILPGEIEGYGWQEDRSCYWGSLYFEEDLSKHPVLSAFPDYVLDEPVDGHFTNYPDNSEVILKKTTNNHPVLLNYKVGLGSMTVTSSILDHDWALKFQRFPDLGDEAVKPNVLMRDMVSWLKKPSELKRFEEGEESEDHVITITNDAPGEEKATLAKVLIYIPGVLAGFFNYDRLESYRLFLRPGIWHVKAELYDWEGNLIRDDVEALDGRFVIPALRYEDAYAPSDIVCTIISDKEVYFNIYDEIAHYEITVENQGEEERNLALVIANSTSDLSFWRGLEVEEITLGPGESVLRTRDIYDHRVTCYVLDIDSEMKHPGFPAIYLMEHRLDGYMVAWGNKGTMFLPYPVFPDLITLDPGKPTHGESVNIIANYSSVSEESVDGEVVLHSTAVRNGNSEVARQTVHFEPGESISVAGAFEIPSDAKTGQTFTVWGYFEDASGIRMGDFTRFVQVPVMDVDVSIDTDKESYFLNENVLGTISFENTSDEDRVFDYQVRVTGGGHVSGSAFVPGGGTEIVTTGIKVPSKGMKSYFDIEVWILTGVHRDLVAKKSLTLDVPLISCDAVPMATPEGINVMLEFSHDSSVVVNVDVLCRLYDRHGVLIGENSHPSIPLPPGETVSMQSENLPIISPVLDKYYLRLYVTSDLTNSLFFDFELSADLRIYFASIEGSTFYVYDGSWDMGEVFERPIVIVNSGDFTFPSLMVTERVPEFGFEWSTEVSVGPKETVMINPTDTFTIPYYRNSDNIYYYSLFDPTNPTRCPVSVEAVAETPTGFSVSETKQIVFQSPKLQVNIEHEDPDLCTSNILSFDLVGISTDDGFVDFFEMGASVEVPHADFSDSTVRMVSTAAPKWTVHYDVELPAGMESGSHEIKAALVQPDVRSYPRYEGDLWEASRTFKIAPAKLTAELAIEPNRAGDAGEVRVINTGMVATSYGFVYELVDSHGVAYLEDAGGGMIGSCGSDVGIPFNLPEGMAGGLYILRLWLQKENEEPVLHGFLLNISGLEAGLDVWTDREIYRVTEPVRGLGTLANGDVALVGGRLHLDVVRLGTGAVTAPQWTALGAGVSRTFSSDGIGEIGIPRVSWEQAPGEMEMYWSWESGPVLGDLDGDGASDAVFASADGIIRAYRGQDGLLMWSYTTGTSYYSTIPQIADVNLDGDAEVVLQLPAAVLCLDGATGQVEWEVALEQEYTFSGTSPVGVADLDGDGSMEVFHLDFQGEGWDVVGFLRARRGSDGAPLWDTRGSGLPFDIDVFRSLSSGDLNGDGRMEIIVVNADEGILMAIGHEGALFWVTQVPDCNEILLPSVADLDGDGLDDVITCCSNWDGRTPWFVLLDGLDGSILWETAGSDGVFGRASSPVTVADLNGDGVMEIAAAFSDRYRRQYDISVVSASGQLLWRFRSADPVVGGMPACDLDGDGEVELLVMDYTEEASSLILLDGATGNLEWNASDHGIYVAGMSHPAVADMDGDGWMEVALASYDGMSGTGRYLVIDSATTSGPAPGGEIIEQVLWETDLVQDLAASEVINLDEDIGILGVTGQLWFRGFMKSSTGQEIARDRYPFLIVEGDQTVSILTDHDVYTEGSTVMVSGAISEISGLPVTDLVLTVREIGGTILHQEALSLDAFGQHMYEFTMSSGALGTHDLIAELTLAGGIVASAQTRYRVETVLVTVDFQAPEVVGTEVFELVAVLNNTGGLAADLELALSDPSGQESRSLMLIPGQNSTQVYERSITEDTTFALDISGDTPWSGDRLVQFGPASFLEVAPASYYSANELIDIPWALSSVGLVPYRYGLNLEVSDDIGTVIDVFSESYYLEEPGDVFGQDVFYGLWNPLLLPGDYLLRYSADFGNTGELPFAVGLPLAVVSVTPDPTYAPGVVEVPWTITNVSPATAIFSLELSINKDGQLVAGWSQEAVLGIAGSLEDNYSNFMRVSLDPGNYVATVDGERVQYPAIAGFQVLPSMDVSFAIASGVSSCGMHPFGATVTNTGWEDFTGFITIESEFWLDRVDLTAFGQGGVWTGVIQVDLAGAEPGTHPVVFSLHDNSGKVITEAEHTVVVQGGVCALSSIPPNASFPAGEEAGFPFVVANHGDQRAVCLVSLAAFEEQGPQEIVVTLDPCAEDTVTFVYLVPSDLGGGDQAIPYTLRPIGEYVTGFDRGVVTFSVEGLEVNVTGSLDKCFYRPGEIAHLDLTVENVGAITDVPLVVEVSYPPFEFEETFILSETPQLLHFEIPLDSMQADRILYVLRFISGRAVFIDAKRVRGGEQGFWLCSDKDVYDAGETVNLTFGSEEDCLFRMRQFEVEFEHEIFLSAGEDSDASFTLPLDIRQGSHVIEYGCEVLTRFHPIEVRGYHVKFLWLSADSRLYVPGDDVSVEALVESGPSFNGPFHCVVERPDESTFDLPIQLFPFEEGYNYVGTEGFMSTDQAGQHVITCTIYLDEDEEIFMAQDMTLVQVGDFEILGIATDKQSYESGYESATAFVRMWGYLPAADLSVDYEGAPLFSQVVQLDGFSTVTIPLTIDQIRELGTHSLAGTLTAEDMTSLKHHNFKTQDTVPPEIEVTGVEEGGFYNDAVTPVIGVFDMNPSHQNVVLDGAIWSSGVEIFFDGQHLLEVEAVDQANNHSELDISFTIDITAPVVTLAGVEDGKCYGSEITPECVVEDPHLVSVDATLNGAPFSIGDLVGEGTHTLHIVAVDEAGNTAEVFVTFTVDLTDPVVAIDGVTDGMVTDLDVFPVVTIKDDNLIFGQAYLNGVEFQAGTAVTEEGDNIIEGWAFDCAGRSIFESARFSIDRTAPELALYFVEDGGCYYPPVWPTYAAYDTNLVSVQALLDGSVFENGSQVDAEGIYTLYVEAEDAVGHVSTLTATFILDATPPVLTVSGVQDGEFYNTDVVVTYSATDANDVETYGILDGEEYVSGTPISEEGGHDIVVVAADCASNQDAFAASFVIDKMPPVVKVEGVEDGTLYSGPVTPFITVTDEYLDWVIIELDGLPFQSGTGVPDEGSHLLFVQASDLAGNVAAVTVAFEIRLGTRPPFHFALCAFGSVLMENYVAVVGYDREEQVKTNDGDVAAHGDVTMRNNSFIAGDVVAGGNLSMKNNTDIYGDVYVAGEMTLKHQAKVHGQIHELGSPPEPCECGYDLDAVLAYRAEKNDNSILEADPSVSPYLSSGILKVEHNDSVTLPGGIFYLDSIILKNNAQLYIAEGARVELYVVHDFTISNHAGLSNAPLRAEDLLVVLGTDTDLGDRLEIHNNTDLGIMLYAPRADLVYPNNAHLYGSIVIRDLHEENHGGIMVYDSLTSDPPPLVCE
jgi:hypothetical protein